MVRLADLVVLALLTWARGTWREGDHALVRAWCIARKVSWGTTRSGVVYFDPGDMVIPTLTAEALDELIQTEGFHRVREVVSVALNTRSRRTRIRRKLTKWELWTMHQTLRMKL